MTIGKGEAKRGTEDAALVEEKGHSYGTAQMGVEND